jgi:hypothetical protein
MISFFRKIRQSLLRQNKVTSYVAYAIGEILLVVIGIMIALQFNNWNENRKDRMFETEILSLIDQNLSRDSLLLSTELNNAELAIQYTNSILDQVAKGIYDEQLNIWLGTVISFERFKSQASAYEVLKSKGIDLLTDNDLQLKLIAYYDESLFNVYQANDDVEDSFNADWIPVVKKEFIDFEFKKRMKPRDQKQFFENPSNIILLKLYKDNRSGSIKRMKTALAELSSIKAKIKAQNHD